VGSASTTASPLPVELASALLQWYSIHRRPLPWRKDRDPYRIWVAEVLLQQTRVAQATPYFERFVRAFPTIHSLARAPVGRVLKVWEGAGYYARAHHLHAAARRIVREYDGEIPTTVPELETLPGIGPYIARAVAAIAFGGREIALEANGVRVPPPPPRPSAPDWTQPSGRSCRKPVPASSMKRSWSWGRRSVTRSGRSAASARRPSPVVRFES